MPLPQQVIDAGKRADEFLTALENQGTETPVAETEPKAAPEVKKTDDEALVLKAKMKMLESKASTADGIAKAAGRETKQLREEINKLREENEAIKKALEQKKEDVVRTPPPEPEPEEDDFYSADELKRIKRVAASAVKSEIELLREELESLKQNNAALNQTATQTQQVVYDTVVDKFNNTIISKHPDTEKLIKDSAFMAWASQPIHPLSKETRISLLSKAQTAYDADAAIRILDEYKGIIAKHKPTGKKDMSGHVLPKNSSASTVNLDTGKQTYTEADILAGYKTLRTLDRGSEEYRKLQYRLDKAYEQLLK